MKVEMGDIEFTNKILTESKNTDLKVKKIVPLVEN
jgi:hypothetical protein